MVVNCQLVEENSQWWPPQLGPQGDSESRRLKLHGRWNAQTLSNCQEISWRFMCSLNESGEIT